jgi:hypothetical protein
LIGQESRFDFWPIRLDGSNQTRETGMKTNEKATAYREQIDESAENEAEAIKRLRMLTPSKVRGHRTGFATNRISSMGEKKSGNDTK